MDTAAILSRAYTDLLAVSHSVRPRDVAAVIAAILALRVAIRAIRKNLYTTSLRGPARTSLIFGTSKVLMESSDPGSIYEEWAKEYGTVYAVPTMFGGKKIMLCDTKAIAHHYARDTWTYVHPEASNRFFLHIFGRGILWAQGELHKRHRKALTPGFGPAAIRNLTPIFYHSAYKAKAVWESLIDASHDVGTVIDVQDWMNHISLDSLGLAAFAHDFGSLDGKPASITKIFDTFGASPKRSTVNAGRVLLAEVFPILELLPTPRDKLLGEMQQILSDISKGLLQRMKKERDDGALDGTEKSIVGVLLKAKDAVNTDMYLTVEEIISQMKAFLFAGYEPTSIILTWALLDLARNPSTQSKLRQELIAFDVDPTYDQMASNLSYLDAVVHEILRLHPPISEFVREASEDDIIPLSQPVRTRFGDVVNSITVARGTEVGINVASINRSVVVWGPDAKTFRPERWLEEGGIPKGAQEVQGYRHLLTFVDGPRSCLGKGFAMTEVKAVLSVLVKNFVFETRDGPANTRVEMGRGLLARPKLAGEEGLRVPLRISRYEVQ